MISSLTMTCSATRRKRLAADASRYLKNVLTAYALIMHIDTYKIGGLYEDDLKH